MNVLLNEFVYYNCFFSHWKPLILLLLVGVEERGYFIEERILIKLSFNPINTIFCHLNKINHIRKAHLLPLYDSRYVYFFCPAVGALFCNKPDFNLRLKSSTLIVILFASANNISSIDIAHARESSLLVSVRDLLGSA